MSAEHRITGDRIELTVTGDPDVWLGAWTLSGTWHGVELSTPVPLSSRALRRHLDRLGVAGADWPDGLTTALLVDESRARWRDMADAETDEAYDRAVRRWREFRDALDDVRSGAPS